MVGLGAHRATATGHSSFARFLFRLQVEQPLPSRDDRMFWNFPYASELGDGSGYRRACDPSVAKLRSMNDRELSGTSG